MEPFNVVNKIIITCSNRIAAYLQKETEELGYKPVRVFKTGIELQGTLKDCIKLNLNLRCASQVLFLVHQCKAATGNDLYNEMIDFVWENIIPADGFFSITDSKS